MVGRHKNSGRGPRGTGQSSGKDRTLHESRRGTKQKWPSLAELSREMPSEQDLEAFVQVLTKEPSDRAAAIMAASLVEQALYTALCCRLADPGQVAVKAWFEGPNAPFGTFSAKIKLGRALAIYGEVMEAKLTTLKDIRNVFAHRSIPIDFGHPTLVREIKSLAVKDREEETDAKVRFCSTCLAFAKMLITDAFENGGKEIEVKYP